MSRPAVLFLGGIGDQILATPALRAIADVLAGDLCLAVVGQRPQVWSDVRCAEYRELFWDGRSLRCAEPFAAPVLISLTSWPNEAALRALLPTLGVSRSIGLLPFYAETVRFEDEGHMLDKYFAVAKHLEPGLALDDYAGPPVFPDLLERDANRRLFSRRRLGQKLLFFHPETKPEKCWTVAGWSAALTEFLSRHPEYDVVSLGAQPFPLELGALASHLIPFHQPLPIAVSAFRHASLFVGVDSCFLHAADAHRVPGLALFGPTEPRAWGFRRSPYSRHVRGSSSSLGDVTPARVSEALCSLVDEIGACEPTRATRRESA